VLYRGLSPGHTLFAGRGLLGAPRRPVDRSAGDAVGTGGLQWLQGHCAGQNCPVCADHGPHRLILSIPSMIASGPDVTFLRCRRCACKFVMQFQPPAYDTTAVSDASLRFYVEQGASLEFFARAVCVASRKPVRSYLDVGCGFGFGPDMASRMFGWDALGIDPGPLAAAGREMLGVTIASHSLTLETRLAKAPYDVIVAMEVIEHVISPGDLLQAMSHNLTQTGTIILSTPDARYLDTSPNGGMVLPILSPGYHAILYTVEALSGLLRKAGFQNVSVTSLGATLFAVASRSGLPTQGTIEPNSSDFAGYLASRFRDAVAGSPIHTGIGSRLLALLVHDHSYGEALGVFAELANALAIDLKIDLTRPWHIAEGFFEEHTDFAEIPGKYPFCLPGLLFQRGLLAAKYEHKVDLACAYLFAARLAARAFLRSFNNIGISDGDTALLPERTAAALKALI
jgi:hypothetical protein